MNIPFTINLNGKTAVVTGGGGVLGSYFARALAACGAGVAVLDLKKEAADEVAEAITREGGKAVGVTANVLDVESLRRAEAVVRETLGPCDILINGAGGNHPRGTTTHEYLRPEDLSAPTGELTTFFDLAPDSVKFVFDLNFTGTLLATQVFARAMVNRPGAAIVNISSMNALRPLTRIPAYSAAKAAVSNFTQWLAVHLSRAGIRVNALAPGFFLTEQNRALLIKEDGGHTDRARKILDHTPLERFGRPEDLTGTLLWLVDEGSSGFVTGIVVPVDGGFSAYSGV